MKILCTLISFLFLSISVSAQITPSEALAQMGRGTNLGNTLEPPTEGAWNNPAAKEAYFDAYVDAGFKTVRIPVTWDKHTATVSPYTITASWLDRVEEIVDWGLSRDMFVILNAHHEGWLKEDFGNPEVRARFDSIWSQISVHFKGKSEKLFFELLNEPRTHTHNGLTQVQIDEANERLLGIIRKDHPTRIVVYSGKGWTSSGDMMAAAVPDDPYIMAYFHSYNPWSFAGESNGTWGSTSDRNAIYSQFATVRNWADQHNVEVLLGEFGAMWDCDYNSRMLHYATYVRGCLKYNLAFTVWDDGGWFEVLKRSSLTWQDSKDILIHTTLQSPDNLTLTVVQDSAIELGWKPGSEPCDTIFIERRVNNGAFKSYAGLAPDATSFVDTLTQNFTDYTYRVITLTDTIRNYSYPAKISMQIAVRKPFKGTFALLPGTVEAEDYDFGGEGLAYHETTEENIPGAYRPKEGVDIENRAGSLRVTNCEPGEWMDYCVEVAEAGTYEVSVPMSSLDGGGIFRIIFNDRPAATLTVPRTGSWTTTTDVSARFDLEAGKQLMRILILKRPPFTMDKFVFSNVTALDEQEMGKLKIYPNPARDMLFISSENMPLEGEISIFSAGGVLLKHLEFGSAYQGIDVSGLVDGIYLLRVSNDKGVVNRRFVIQR